MFVTRQYTTDIGIILGYLKMEIALIVGEDMRSRRQIRDLSSIEEIIPASLSSLLVKMNSSCEADILPRFAILNLEDDRRLKLSYPFQPGSTDWQIFWNDLLANPQILLAKGTGETITNSFLNRIQ